MRHQFFAGPWPGRRAANRKLWRMESQGTEADIYLYDIIGDSWDGTDAKQFAADLKALGDVKVLNLYINSEGGSVFDGVAMYNQLVRHRAKKVVTIDGIAASIASIVAMSGDEIRMAPSAMMMVHKPWAFAMGNAPELRQSADSLDKIEEAMRETYCSRTGCSNEEIQQMLAAETWMTAADCIAKGFADSICETRMAAVAQLTGRDLSMFRNVPDTLKPALAAKPLAGASGSPDLPLAARDHSWDVTAADQRVRKWASSDGSGDKDKMDWAKYKSAHFWYNAENESGFGGYKLQFADVIDDKLTGVPRGIFACAGVMQGARGGVDIPEGDRDAVKAKIAAYYGRMRKEFNDDSIVPPWEQDNSNDLNNNNSDNSDKTAGPAPALRSELAKMEAELAFRRLGQPTS